MTLTEQGIAAISERFMQCLVRRVAAYESEYRNYSRTSMTVLFYPSLVIPSVLKNTALRTFESARILP